MFHFLPPPLNSIVPFLIVLGVLVFFHELGHYLAARWMGVHVEAFSIGFGRVLARWRDRRGTEWRISLLPFGGYVKLHGQERPEEVGSDVRALWQPGRTFHEKSVARRAVVIAAGPIANFLLASLLFAGMFAWQGRPVLRSDATLGEVSADSPAARAGLLPGDVVLRVDDAPVASFADLRALVQPRPDARITVTLRRATAVLTVPLTTTSRVEDGQKLGTLGVAAGIDYVPVSVPRALLAGTAQTWDVGRQILSGIGQIVSGHRGAGDVGGFLRIAQLSGQQAALGLASLVNLVAILSVNLGLINLFPIPVLDGGHLLFYLVEAVRGRPLPPRAIEYGFRAGIALIAALFVFAAWNDLTHLGVVRWVAGLVGSS